jgi:hypothetical protein
MTIDFIEAGKIESNGDRCHVHAGVGRILFPEEVEAATVTAEHSDAARSELAGHWLLCGDVTPKMFDQVKANSEMQRPARLTVLTAVGDENYCVFTSQIGSHQHRFLLPLYEPMVQDFIRAIQVSPLGFMFANDGMSDAVVVFPEVSVNELAPVLSYCKPVPMHERLCLQAALPFAVQEVLNPGRIPTFPGMPKVDEVSLSIVFPNELSDEMLQFWRDMVSESKDEAGVIDYVH